MTTDKEIIQETYWMLVEIEGSEIQSAADARTAFIRFREGKDDVNGYSGCNNFFGKYELNETQLTISKLGSTRMMCPDIEQENRLMQVLERTDSFNIADNILTLFEKDTAIATFRAGNGREIELSEQ